MLAGRSVPLLTACAVLWCAGCSPPPRQPGSVAAAGAAGLPAARAAIYTDWLFAGQVDSLWAALSDRGRHLFPVPDSLAAFRAAVVPVVPGFERVLADSVERTDTLVSVWRRGVNVRDGAAYVVRWHLTPGDLRVSGISVRDAGLAAETPMLGYEPRTRLRLPFEGEWIVFWGGPTVEENYHAAYPHQRFAMDLIPAEDSARIWRAARGEPTELADFACYGAAVVAPADGVVVAALDTVPDNPVGHFHPTSELGNHLVIRHLPGEYSLLAHLRRGSVRVRAGETVRSGQVVAECGNSGRTTAPHLHYDLRDSPEVGRGTYSLPARFHDYVAGGEHVPRGEPRRWQRLRPAH